MFVAAVVTAAGSFGGMISTRISALFLHFWPVQLAQ
jgi:hypothetical protein